MTNRQHSPCDLHPAWSLAQGILFGVEWATFVRNTLAVSVASTCEKLFTANVKQQPTAPRSFHSQMNLCVKTSAKVKKENQNSNVIRCIK